MRTILITVLFLIASPAWCTSYFMSTSGSDGNNGTSTGTAWASPNHALNCGDTITAAAGAYPVNSFAFGVVTCAGNNNVAWLQCATAFACTGTVTSGGQYAQGFGIGNSYWGVQGWVLSTYSGGGSCFTVIPNSTTVSISHIIFANNIANGCGQGGINFSTNGTAGVDYIAVVGNIVYNAASGSNNCTSGINDFEPVATDALPGTHIYFAGNFAFDSVNPATCAGNTPGTDGEGLFFDTMQTYAQQMVMDNNISVFNGGNGIKIYSSTASPSPKVYFRYNTTYGNETGGVNGGSCSEMGIQSAYSTEMFYNLAVTTAATACSGAQTYYAYGGLSSNSTSTFWNNYGYSASSNNISAGGANNVNNTFANPSLSNPTNPGAPSCGSFSTTVACMATVIANFAPTAAAAKASGYQPVSTTSRYDPLYPQWLCSNVNLPTGLVTPGCLTASVLTGATSR